ncbi:hypothetical protein [Piscibacillus salipiscarius]|uniref:Uncharacterized protein n=1 Tax=Piscibacillus salipiscarius TaxID=299480 RepID=A0ABW5QAM6_9BACI|nr:hypothetical protein [Piscibacillus salipiscarius]
MSLEHFKDESIPFSELNPELQHHLFDSLIGERVLIKMIKHDELIELEGIIERKSLYLGEVAYDLKVAQDMKAIKVNLLYDIQEVRRMKSQGPMLH